MNDDALKKTFEQAFANETIVYDPKGWEAMEAMLNKRKRRTGFWLWFLGAGIVILTSWIAMDGAKATYKPRQVALNLEHIPSLERTINKPQSQTLNTQNPNKTETSPDNITSNSHVAGHEAGSSPLDGPSSASHVEEEPTTETSKEEAVAETLLDTVPATLSLPATAMTELRDDLGLMDGLPLSLFSVPTSLQDRTVKQPHNRPVFVLYSLAGINYLLPNPPSFSAPSFGQFAGIGGELLIKGRFGLSMELTGVRTPFEDITETEQTTYGYSKIQNQFTTQTSELLFAELPLIFHCHFNRLGVGAGVSATYLIASKNTTIHTTSSEELINELDRNTAYETWDRYRTFNTSVLLDVNYQFASRLALGIRPSYGMGNVYQSAGLSRNLMRTDLYLKIQLH